MNKQACDAKARSEGRCRLCLRSWAVRRPTRHRIVPGRLNGRYEPRNVVPLCRPCHNQVDHWDATIRGPARRMLRAAMWPIEIHHAIARLGRREFDQRYPRPARELVLARRLGSGAAEAEDRLRFAAADGRPAG